jgi:hypothetical protein
MSNQLDLNKIFQPLTLLSWSQQTNSGSRSWSSITSSSDGTKLAAAVNVGYIYTAI